MNPKRFFAELKRRNVYRAAVLYGMSAWLIAQITTQIFPFFNVPNSAVRFVIIALALGFPIAMALAWIYELTPAGLVRTEDVDSATQRQFGRKVDFVIIGVLLLEIAILVYQRLPFRAESAEAIPEKSVAVLPFVNFSEEKANALDGATMNHYLALIYARVGENDLALQLIERLLKTPGAVDTVDYSITINDLKYRWAWDLLRSDPRFQKLISSAEAQDSPDDLSK
jgi:hypothetical protein